jgi:hypothetical protein
MTLYLWHMPALLGIHLAFDYLGWPRYPGQSHFVAISVAQAVLMTLLTGLLFLILRPLENTPLPGWDGAAVTQGARDVAVGILLCVAGLATLVSVKWGLKDQGLYCVAVMLAALVAARMMSATRWAPTAYEPAS